MRSKKSRIFAKSGFKARRKCRKEKIETALGVGPRTILDRTKVAEGVEKVRKLYQ